MDGHNLTSSDNKVLVMIGTTNDIKCHIHLSPVLSGWGYSQGRLYYRRRSRSQNLASQRPDV
jgi:hypothetical protein